MRKSTIIDLPKEIEALIPEKERTPLIQQIISEAKAGQFHGYKNEKYGCGKVQSAHMLHSVQDEYSDKEIISGLEKIRNGIINGDYDESPDAEDKAKMKKDWIDNGGTIQQYEKMFGK